MCGHFTLLSCTLSKSTFKHPLAALSYTLQLLLFHFSETLYKLLFLHCAVGQGLQYQAVCRVNWKDRDKYAAWALVLTDMHGLCI